MGRFFRLRGRTGLGRTAFAGCLLATVSPLPMRMAATSVQAQTVSGMSFAVPAGPLGPSLTAFGRQSGLQISYLAALAQGKTTAGYRGTATPQAALSAILGGTGLTFAFSDAGTVVVRAPATQGPGGGTQLDTIDVTGNQYPTDPNAGMTNPQTTIGSKLPQTFRQVPHTADVITNQNIRQQNVTNLADALRNTPGVTVFDFDADRKQYFVRGYPIASFQIDGVPVATNPVMSSAGTTDSPSLAMYDRIEVLDGPAGLYNGFGSPGGALNLMRKRAPGTPEWSIQTGLGTGDALSGTVDVGGPLNQAGTLRGRLVANAEKRDLVWDGTWQRDQSYYGTIEDDLTPDTTLRLGASFMDRTSNAGWGNVTPTYTNGKPVAGRSTFFGAPWNRDHYQSTDVFATLDHDLGDTWKLSAGADYTLSRGTIYSGEFFGQADPDTDTGTFGTTNKRVEEKDTSLDVNLSGKYSLFGRQAEAVFGANYAHINNPVTFYYGDTSSYTSMFHWTTVNIHDYSYPEVAFTHDPAHTLADVSRADNYGLYGSTRITLTDPLTLIAGARLSWWSYKDATDPVNNLGNPTAPVSGSYDGKFTPYAGLVYDFDKTTSAYLSYASVFQPQYGLKRGGGFVAPLQGNQYEAGLKSSWFDDRLNASGAVFVINQKNRSLNDPTDPTYTYYIDGGRARSQGVDLRLSGQIAPGWTIFTGYTYNYSKYLDQNTIDYVGTDFSQIAPRHLLKIWTDYRLPGAFDRWSIGGGLNLVSTLYYGSGASKVVQPTYSTAALHVGYKVSDRMDLDFTVSNLFDKSYYQPNWSGVVYGDKRRATLMLTLRNGG